MRTPRLLSAVALLALVTACGVSGAPRASASPTPAPTMWIAKHTPRPSPTPVIPSKVLVVVEENHNQNQALSEMPYLASLASSYGRTTDYHALMHLSLPNYLAIAGGSTFGVMDDNDPSSHPLTAVSAFDRVIAHGHTAKTYAEGMPSNCALTSSGSYAVRHNPWTYFASAGSRANCRQYDVPAGTRSAGALRSDLDAGRLPTVGMLVPDLCNDAHDCSLATADTWLKAWLPTIMAGPDYRAGRLAVIVTFDEDDDAANSTNTVLSVVVSPYTKGIRSTATYSHYSLTRYFGEISGTTPVGAGATAPSLRAAFHI